MLSIEVKEGKVTVGGITVPVEVVFLGQRKILIPKLPDRMKIIEFISDTPINDKGCIFCNMGFGTQEDVFFGRLWHKGRIIYCPIHDGCQRQISRLTGHNGLKRGCFSDLKERNRLIKLFSFSH